MTDWQSAFLWGKRASDRPQPKPRRQRRDMLLEAVIASEQIDLLFQPQIEPGSGRIAGAEALARWGGADTAAQLFARAEAAGLAERLSRLIQRRALRVAAAWEGSLKNLNVSINLLPEELARPDYDEWLLEEIRTVGIMPERVTVEITENALISDQPMVAKGLARLREAGIGIAIDDFGTGYCNLAYLISLPIDTLKIDRALITDLVGGARDQIVVKAMIRLAHELGMKVVVEGVESSAQLVLLASWGCDFYQGFLGAGALSQEELARFVSASSAAAA